MLFDVVVALIKVRMNEKRINVIGLPAFKPGDKIKLDLSNDNIGGVRLISNLLKL